ncbi:hypothetical protein U1Q18_040126 [Sarracenia purpurea var. burkii]
MEGQDSSGSGLCCAHMEDEKRSCDGIAAAAELPSVKECEPIAELDDSHLVGVPLKLSLDSVAGGAEGAPAATDAEFNVKERAGEKRKRGRPPRAQAKSPPTKRMEEEEDVCFICFDGGSLVLCDRRGCPKAYHPACIKRDEAFFRSKAKWNCGWHICSICQKSAHYMCYTCTFSLCKACTKDADYLCVRENKGFCTICMRTIMLIENNDQANKEMAQVDFDDKSSWEYLFKVYWIYLKDKLSLTLEEITQAKNPWKAAGTVACKRQSLNKYYGGFDGKGSISDGPFGHLETNDSRRKRTKEQPKLPNNEESLSTGKSSIDDSTASIRSAEWASKELLQFVAHMKNGDTSVLTQFDVQGLLLEYIKRNNLRDPRRKSQIVCDLRLKTLFGKKRVGHIEMLKLLEFHFLIKEDPMKDVIQDKVGDAVLSQAEGAGNNENQLTTGKDKKRKTRRKGEERGKQINLDEYAAISVHNINLIYLRRHLMEALIVDNGNFHEKVVGSIVRIRISSGDQKQDMYRLVQVVGTCKAAVPYKVGEKTADVKLEILNLDKKETISIDVISNQEFTEDECRRLRQSIKCGLVQRLTVGQVLEKAKALQEVRLNDWLETEVLRLNHLRDRASEKGHKKELRECVEKLELLKTPEEHQRRLHEIPDVQSDPNMDPNCESDKDSGGVGNKKQDEYMKPKYSGFSRNEKVPISSRNAASPNNSGGKVWKKLMASEQNRSTSTKFYLDKGAFDININAGASNSSEKTGNQVDSSGSMVGGWNNQAVVLKSGSFSEGAPETSISSLSTGSAPSANDGELNKLWHYRDPNGKIQGPFCMLQLRKWSTTGYFPLDMRIWSISNEEVDSLLLTDVLNGKFHKGSPDSYSGSMNTTVIDGKWNGGGGGCNNAIGHSNRSNEFVKGDGWGSHSSNWTPPVGNNVPLGNSFQCWESLKVKTSCSDHPQVHCPQSSSEFTELQNKTPSHQGKGHDGGRWNSGGPNHGNGSSHGNTFFQTISGQGHENQSDSQGCSGQSSGESWRPLPINVSSHNRDSNSGFGSVAKSTDLPDQSIEIDIPNLLSLTTPKTCNGYLEDRTAKDHLGILIQHSAIQKLASPTPKMSDGVEKADSNIQNLPSSSLPKPMDGVEKVQDTENKRSVCSTFRVQDSGPSWSSASSLVVGGGTQCLEIADEWGGYSPTRAKPSVEEWDSGLGSVSSLIPPEAGNNDHAATPTSKCDQLTPSPSHPELNNASSWQVTFSEPIEFSTLAEESVSDLLAEVDAMESQCGLGSPTSVMYGEELFHDCKNDCFPLMDGFSPPLDSGKNDALSSTGDITLPPHRSTMTDEALEASPVDILDPTKRSGRQSSTSAEVEVETRPADISGYQSEAGSTSTRVHASSTSSLQVIMDTDTAQRAWPIPVNTGWGTMQQGTLNLGLGGSTPGMTNVGWENCLETGEGNANMNSSAGVMGLESHPKYGGEISIDPREYF